MAYIATSGLHWKLIVFYDGGCPLCSREMSWLERRSPVGVIVYEDLNSDSCTAAQYGLTRNQLMDRIHGVTGDGRVLEGMELFRELYSLIGLGWLIRPTGWPVIRPIADWLYMSFARNRLRITGRAGESCAINKG